MKNSFKLDFWKKTKKIAKKLTAFTVAELVIALASIAFISAITLGTITKQVDIQKNTVARTTINNEFAVSLADMHADRKLVGIKSPLEFANKIQEYFGIEGDVVNKNGTVSRPENAPGQPLSYNDFAEKNFAEDYIDKSGNKITPTSFETLFKSDKGVSIALTYNASNCNITGKFVTDASSGETSGINKYDYTAKNDALTCITGIYDINGPKGPNKFGEDVGFFNQIKGNCTGKYAMDVNGKCSICTITNANCKAENKTLDKDTCDCKCTRKCPKGMNLDIKTCTCKCPKAGEFNKDYCELPPDNTYSCMPVLKKATTPAQCTISGGKWKAETCDCTCDNEKCYNESLGYGIAKNDPAKHSFCACKCKYKDVSQEFLAEVEKNAKKDGLTGDALAQAIANTIPANHNLSASMGCYACKKTTSDDGNISYELRNGYCSAGCNADAQAKCSAAGDFFKWIPYDPTNPSNSCKCVCNTEAKKKELAEINKKFSESYKVLDMDNADSKKVWQVLREAVIIGKLNAKETTDRSICPESYAYRDLSCTYCSSAKSNETTKRVVEAYINDGKPKNSADIPKYEFDENKCLFTFNKEAIRDNYNPSNVTKEVHMHGACNNWWGWQFQNIKWADNVKLDNPNAQRPKDIPGYDDSHNALSDSYWNQEIKITGGTPAYNNWADPIVLNYTSVQDTTSSLKDHITTNKVSFKLHWSENGYKEVKTPWVKAKDKIENSHLFLVAPNAQGKVPDVSYMFSDQKKSPTGDLYTTGLEQLMSEYDTTVDKEKDATYAFETGLINKNDVGFAKLRAWWDKNNNAVVDSGELKTLDELKIIEINTNVIRDVDKQGNAIQSADAVFGIKGEYKRLIAYTPAKTEANNSSLWWPIKKQKVLCHVVPVYDEKGKQLLDTWEIDKLNSHESCFGPGGYVKKETALGKIEEIVIQNTEVSATNKDFAEEKDDNVSTNNAKNQDNNSTNAATLGANGETQMNNATGSSEKQNMSASAGNKSQTPAAQAPSQNASNGEATEKVKTAYYVIYSPRKAVKQTPNTSKYEETWFQNDSGRTEIKKSDSYQFIKLYKIGNKYYTEKIFSLNDIIFIY